MNERLRIYIAGPYCPQNCSLHDATRIAQKNVDKAIEVGNALMRKGHYVFIPHLSHYMHIHFSNISDYGKDFWYELDLTFLDLWANALFLIDHSYGADLELTKARDLGYQIFTKIEEMLEVRP